MHRRKVRSTVTAPVVAALAVTLLSAGTAVAAGTPQQNCDKARLLAWGGYVGCLKKAEAAAYYKGVENYFDASYRAQKYWRCRHRYLSKWTAFQTRYSLAGSTCSGARFVDNGATVTDNLTGLVWEKKVDLTGCIEGCGPTAHDWLNTYTWSSGPPWNGTGTAFSSFLFDLNSADFDGTKGWRLPTVPELASILLDAPCLDSLCTCGSHPCIDPVFGPTRSLDYWSATPRVDYLYGAWAEYFSDGGVVEFMKNDDDYVRAVRGGL